MAERFNGRIADMLRSRRFRNARELSAAATGHLHSYNHIVAQCFLGHRTSAQVLCDELNTTILPGPDTGRDPMPLAPSQ